MNTIHIAGHLGADPETRFTSSGKKVTTIRVAVSTRRGQKEGQKEDTIWFRVTVWGDQFDKMLSFLKKGSAIMVVGELHKPEIYNDKEGKPQTSLEVTAISLQFSPFGKPNAQPGQGAPQQGSERHESAPNPYMGSPAKAGAAHGQTFDDEVPF